MNTLASLYRQPRRKLTTARIVILGIAVVAGGSAAYLAAMATPTIVQVVQQAPSIKTIEVLVVKSELKVGATIKAADMRWQLWPADGLAPGVITRESAPEAMKEMEGAVVLGAIAAGEAIRPDRILRNPRGGQMAAMLPPGFRALAINIDGRGATSAGGFILPNDRVDVIKVMRDEGASRSTGGDVMISETIVRNVRVLAIGKNFLEQNGEKLSVGETATLELDPKQVETIYLAQRTGQLTLALRSLQDAEVGEPEPPPSATVNVRYSSTSSRRFACDGKACSEGK